MVSRTNNVDFNTLKKQIFEETNKLRTNPKSYAKILEDSLQYFGGKNNKTFSRPGKIGIITEEGKAAVQEAIDFLNKEKPIHALILDNNVSKAAQDHANDIGPSGSLDHHGSDGLKPSARIEKYVEWKKKMCENIDFGSENGQEVVLSLVVDDGVEDRGHRKNLFNTIITHCGIGCGSHKEYGTVSVIDYVGGVGQLNIKGKDKNPTPITNSSNTKSSTSDKKSSVLNNLTNKMNDLNVKHSGDNPFANDEHAPKNATSCSTKITTSTVGKKVTKTTVKTYKCSDGSTKTVELVEETHK